MKNLLKKIKDSSNLALALFAILGLILNEILDLSIDNTAIKSIVELVLNLI